MRAVRFLPLSILLVLSSPTLVAGITTTYLESFDTDTYKDSVATAADWNTQLGVLRMPDFPMRIFGTFDAANRVYDAASYGQYAVLAVGTEGLFVVDATYAAPPTFVGSTDLGGRPAYSVVTDGQFAYVASGVNGILVVSLADPAYPEVVGSWGPSTEVFRIDVEGNLAYVADRTSLQILDIADPPDPQVIGTYNISCFDVTVEGDIAYLAGGPDGLAVLDVSDVAAPRLISQSNVGGAPIGIAVDGDWAYLAVQGPGLVIVNVEDLEQPIVEGTFELPGSATDVTFCGDFIYVTDDDLGVSVVDVTDPSNPSLVSVLDTPGLANSVYLDGDLGYVSDLSGGLHVFQIVRLILAPPFAAFSFSDFMRDIEVHGDIAFMANGTEGLKIVDVSHPSAPQLMTTFNPGHEVWDVALAGNYAFLVPGVTVLDIRDPANPTLMGSEAADGAEILVEGNYAYIAAIRDGLQIYDVGDPERPTLAGQYVPDGVDHEVYAVAVSGDFAAIATHEPANSRLYLLDVANPTNPVVLDLEYFDNWSQEIHFDGNRLYVGGTSGLFIYAFDPHSGSLTLLGSESSSPVYDFEILGTGVFTTAPSGVQLVIVADPANPDASDIFDDGGLTMAFIGQNLVFDEDGTGQIASAELLHRRFDLDGDHAYSLTLNDHIGQIVAVRAFSPQSQQISWSVSAQGSHFQYLYLDSDYAALDYPGDDLRWRAELHYWGHDVRPVAEDFQVDWLYQYGIIQCINDIPEDQGGQVRLKWTQSGFDITDSETPITQYAIYRRIDDPSGKNTPANGEGERDYPPGEWDYIDSVPATADEEYAMVVPTLSDSSIAGGMHWSVFFVRALTETPSIYYNSPPDSGYSVDNLAPGVPENFHFEQTTVLAWDEAVEEDFDYFTVYGSPIDHLDETAVVIGQTTGTQMDVAGDPYPYYHLTATDFAGNEGHEASLAGASDLPEGTPLPRAFALHQPVPNPGLANVAFFFDLPVASHITLAIFDVSGRRLITLMEGSYPAGAHSVVWRGLGGNGTPVQSGVYFVRLKAGPIVQSHRFVVSR